MRLRTDKITGKQPRAKRFVMGFAALATAGTIGAAGLVGAAPTGKPSPEDCASRGFKNYGLCVADWAKNKPNPGGGNTYGNSSVTVETTNSADVSGDGNVVHTVVNAVYNIYNFF